MKNYICINGKKAELTEEQMRALGIELPKANPFERVKKGGRYYSIEALGNVYSYEDNYYGIDTQSYENANYCTDKSIMEHRALHETLNRMLWRYAMEHNSIYIAEKYFVTQNQCTKELVVHKYTGALVSFGEIAFSSERVALNAIEEVVKPFLAEHTDFKF